MDVDERLSLDAVSAHTLIACEHIHRYALARELCDGSRVLDLCCGTGYGAQMLAASALSVHGVDNDVATVDTAAAAIGTTTGLTFEAADALEFLRQDLADRFDVIVCFEGLEHLPDVDAALSQLRRHAGEGVRLVASVPNSRAFGEANEYHVTSFGYDEAQAAFSGFPNAVTLHQFLAEGSVIVPPEAEGLDSELVGRDRMEPEYANHFVCCVNFDAATLERAVRGRIQLEAAPAYNRYMRNLEGANRDLRGRNAQLARARLGKADSAAASYLSGLEAERARMSAELDVVKAELRLALDELDGAREGLSRAEESMASAEHALARRWSARARARVRRLLA